MVAQSGNNRRASRSGSSGGIAQGVGKRQSLPRDLQGAVPGSSTSGGSGTPTAGGERAPSLAGDRDAGATSSGTGPTNLEFRPRRHSSLQVDKDAPVASIMTDHDFRGSGTTTMILINIFRALLARALFIVHSLTTIWATVSVREDNSIWTFALISVSIVVEGCYAIVMRAGDERKWFSPSVLLYILATAPPIWLLETKMCEFRKIKGVNEFDDKLQLQLLEQLLLVMLIVGRWLLPKGEISREQLSQILLAYLAISSDIVEFFDVFKERIVYQNRFIQYIVLSAWTLSLLQFPFILTVSRARKMRVAITNEDATLLEKRSDMWQVFYDIDIWAILLANSLQDIPFFAVRLYLMVHHGLVTYTMIFFICKNALIIVLQTYRGFVLFNDRYIHPKLEFRARALIEEQNRRMSSIPSIHSTQMNLKQQQQPHTKKKGSSSHQGRKSITPREKTINLASMEEHPPQPHSHGRLSIIQPQIVSSVPVQQASAVYQIDDPI